jgi:hypothetical protein
MTDSPIGKTYDELGVPDPRASIPSSSKPSSAQQQQLPTGESPVGKTYDELGVSENQALSPGWDLAKSVGSGLQSAAIGFAASPVDIPSLISKGIDYPLDKSREYAVRGYNWLSGEGGTPEGDARLEDLQKSIDFRNKINEEGRFLPGYQDIAGFIDPYVKATGLPGPLYQPETTPGKFTKTITEFVAPGIAGKEQAAQKGIKTFANIIGGAGSEAAGEYAESAGLSPVAQATARILGGLGLSHYGERIGTTVKNIAAPTEMAEQRIAEEIATARQRGVAPTDAEIQQNLQSQPAGAQDTSAYDLLGKAGPELVQQGIASPGGKEAAQAINDMLSKRAAAAEPRINNAMDQLYGGTIDAVQTKKNMMQGIAVDNPILFNRAMNSPEAQNVRSNIINNIETQPLAQNAIDDAAKAFNLQKPGGDFQVRLDRFNQVRASRGQPTINTIKEFKQQIADGNIREYVTPDNLPFWHEVKTNMDDQVNKAFTGGDPTLGRNLKAIRDNLRSDLRNTVPDYGDALNISSDYFQGKNAVEAGYNFGKNDVSSMDLPDKQAAFKRFGPVQQRQFEEGHMQALKEKMLSGSQGAGQILPNADAEVAKVNAMYGPQKAASLSSIANTENIFNLKNMINMTPPTAPKDWTGMAIENLKKPVGFAALSSLLMNPSFTGIAAGGFAGAEFLKRLALTVEERAVSAEVNKILSNQSPSNVARLSKLAEQKPAVNSLLNKYQNLMTQILSANGQINPVEVLTANAQLRPSVEKTLDQQRQGRKSGGRISDKLVMAADRAKKNINGTTENLLNVPDTHVAQALELANKYL